MSKESPLRATIRDAIAVNSPNKPKLDDSTHAASESLLYRHATGELSPPQIHSQMPKGYAVDLRGKNGPYQATAPDGWVHHIQV